MTGKKKSGVIVTHGLVLMLFFVGMAYQTSAQLVNLRPVIGVLSQPDNPQRNYLTASYVKVTYRIRSS